MIKEWIMSWLFPGHSSRLKEANLDARIANSILANSEAERVVQTVREHSEGNRAELAEVVEGARSRLHARELRRTEKRNDLNVGSFMGGAFREMDRSKDRDEDS